MREVFKINCYPLSRAIRVFVRIPDDYYQTNRYYPLIYFLDGQSIFEEKDSTIKIEDIVAKLHEEDKEAIFLGIAGAANSQMRSNEYANTDLAKFIFNEIHPLICSRYRINNYIYGCFWGTTALNGLALVSNEPFKAAILINPEIDNLKVKSLNLKPDLLYYLYGGNELIELLDQSNLIAKEMAQDLNSAIYEAMNNLVL